MARTRARTLKVVALSTVVALALAACSSSSQETANTEPRDSVVFAIAGGNLENGHMDPHSSQLDVSAYVQRNVFDSLVAMSNDGELIPWLATQWTVSEDGRTYTFTLRDDVTFHDGEHFDAAAAVRNFEHIQADETASAQALAMIGGELFDRAEATGDYELTLHLTEPFAPLLTNLTTAFTGFYSPAVLDAHSQDDIKAGGPEVSVGTGPYKLTEYTPAQQIVYTANEDYAWGPALTDNAGEPLAATPGITTLTVRILPEESARIGALQSGQADISVDLTANALTQLGDLNSQNAPSPGMPYSAILNWSHGHLSDQKVRQAVQVAVNLDEAVPAALGDSFQRSWSVLSPSTVNAFDESTVGSWPYDPEQANTLLDEAGWSERDADGYRVKDGERLRLEWLSWLPFSDEKRALVTFLVDDLKKVGVELVHEAVEGPDYQARYFSEEEGMILDFDITDWGFASLDGDVMRQHLHSAGYQNATTVADSDLDALLEEAATTTDPAQRLALYGQVQQWNVENVAMIPLYSPQFITAWSDSISGIAFDRYGWPLLHGISATN